MIGIGIGVNFSRNRLVTLMDPGKGTFDSGTESWTAYGNNTIENDAGALKVSYVDTANGALTFLRASSDLSADLEIGVNYRIKIRAKQIEDATMYFYVVGPGVQSSAIQENEYTWLTIDFTATSTDGDYLRCIGMSADAVIWVDRWYIYKR